MSNIELSYKDRRIKSLQNKVESQIKLIFELSEELEKSSNCIYNLRKQLKVQLTKSRKCN